MPADDVLQLPGYAKKDAFKPPEKIGEDENDYVVKWFYPDVTITFRWSGNPLCYRVVGMKYYPAMDYGVRA